MPASRFESAGGAALLVAALALCLCGACRGTDPSPPTEAPTTQERSIERPRRRPAPTPLSANPQRRKLGPQGQLLESADAMLGFRLPMGVEPARQTSDGVVLAIQTSMDRLVRFYASRGYHVVRGRESGYKVLHSRRTLAGQPEAERLANVRLYLHPGAGRVKELRIVETRAPQASPEDERRAAEAADGPQPDG